jgi:hypothetical protein
MIGFQTCPPNVIRRPILRVSNKDRTETASFDLFSSSVGLRVPRGILTANSWAEKALVGNMVQYAEEIE